MRRPRILRRGPAIIVVAELGVPRTPRRLLLSFWKYSSQQDLTDSQSQRHLKNSTAYRQVRPTTTGIFG